MDIKRRFNGTEAELTTLMGTLETRLKSAGAPESMTDEEIKVFHHVIALYAADLANEGMTFADFRSIGKTYFECVHGKDKQFKTEVFKSLVYTLGPLLEAVDYVRKVSLSS